MNRDTTNPPANPIKSATATSNGSIKVVAITRGVTSLRVGSVPIARIASTCSDTTIEPSSDAIADAFRPATNNPVIVGPNSRTSPSATTSPVKAVCPNRANCEAVCKTKIPPMNPPVSITIGSEPTPMLSICWTRSFTYCGGVKMFATARAESFAYSCTCSTQTIKRCEKKDGCLGGSELGGLESRVAMQYGFALRDGDSDR